MASFAWARGSAAIGDTLADIAVAADAAGCEHVSVMDHYFQIDRMFAVDDPMLEAYTTLGYLAASTARVRLHVLATGVTYRHPGLLAKIVATLDALSGGRAELAIGAAWYEREHRGLGVPFPPLRERLERLEEAIRICLQMWSDDDGPFEGERYRLAETLCSPRPAGRPRLIVCGGGERRTLRIAARYGDESNVIARSAEEVARKRDVLRAHCEDIGRDPAEVVMSVLYTGDALIKDDTARFVQEMRPFAALGVETVIVMPLVEQPVAFVERLGREVVPALAEL
ncbi:MAG TPA: TIGR03560 family F420-dependent LLM class oxidoreductase [Solirubrobacteraceae bacterium]|nr:TIGR03560 family F420-dependent LLM class oxidoreductase [Solirubrobacteraceae bacterium]